MVIYAYSVCIFAAWYGLIVYLLIGIANFPPYVTLRGLPSVS